MSLVDHHGEVEYPFSVKTVFDAIIEASSKIEGLELDGADEVSGRVTFKAGVSLASWGENIPVQLTTISNCRTKMQIMSSPKTGLMFGGAMDMGKNHRNIEKIITAVSNILKDKSPETEVPTQNPISSADELLKLKQLLDAGVLTQGEFEEQKKIILTNANKPTSSHSETKVDNTLPTPLLNDKPLHIEGSSNDNTVLYCIIAIVVIVVVVLLSTIE